MRVPACWLSWGLTDSVLRLPAMEGGSASARASVGGRHEVTERKGRGGQSQGEQTGRRLGGGGCLKAKRNEERREQTGGQNTCLTLLV